MAISGQQHINVGLPNESANSDSLWAAFTKTNTNFTNLFTYASPFNTFDSGDGVSINANAITGVVSVQNTGVLNIIAGTNITVDQSNGNVTISSSGGGGGGGGSGTVTSIGVTGASGRIVTSGGPVVSSGTISVDLATSGVTAGTYSYPVMTVDTFGRITSIANGASAGTVTSVGITPGVGIQVTGSPVTTSGVMTLINTGVTRLTAGSGIVLSSSNGNITVSATTTGGTVTSVGVSSNTLTVTNSPVVAAGSINVELPSNITVSGNIVANTITTATGSNANLIINPDGTGDVLFSANTELVVQSGANSSSTSTGAIQVTGGVGLTGNIYVGGIASVTGNISTSGNLLATTGYVSVANGFVSTNVYSGSFTSGVVVDYTSGWGRISVGTSAGIRIYKNGVGSSLLQTIDANGNVTATGTVTSGNILSSGSILSNSTTGIGYTTGSGSTVTQITSRTTGVTINAITGAITLVSAAGSATYATFTVTNNKVVATDVIIINQKSGTDKYAVFVSNVATGSFAVTFADLSGTTTEQPVFNFAVIKGVTS